MTFLRSSNSAARQLFITPAIAAEQVGTPRWKTYDRRSFGEIPQMHHLSPDIIASIRLATLVFPFKVNEYALDNLIDWSRADEVMRLVWPMVIPWRAHVRDDGN
jgi:hypothetical protein